MPLSSCKFRHVSALKPHRGCYGRAYCPTLFASPAPNKRRAEAAMSYPIKTSKAALLRTDDAAIIRSLVTFPLSNVPEKLQTKAALCPTPHSLPPHPTRGAGGSRSSHFRTSTSPLQSSLSPFQSPSPLHVSTWGTGNSFALTLRHSTLPLDNTNQPTFSLHQRTHTKRLPPRIAINVKGSVPSLVHTKRPMLWSCNRA